MSYVHVYLTQPTLPRLTIAKKLLYIFVIALLPLHFQHTMETTELADGNR